MRPEDQNNYWPKMTLPAAISKFASASRLRPNQVYVFRSRGTDRKQYSRDACAPRRVAGGPLKRARLHGVPIGRSQLGELEAGGRDVIRVSLLVALSSLPRARLPSRDVPGGAAVPRPQ